MITEVFCYFKDICSFDDVYSIITTPLAWLQKDLVADLSFHVPTSNAQFTVNGAL
jgi:hypothetical protein